MLRVKEICKEKNITLKVLSKKMGITYQSLHSIITGDPKRSSLERLAKVLDVPIQELFESPMDIYIKYQDRMVKIGPKQIRKVIKDGPQL